MSAKDWTHGPSSGWTPEQAQQAATYGVCLTCGCPRELKVEDGVTDLVCPNCPAAMTSAEVASLYGLPVSVVDPPPLGRWQRLFWRVRARVAERRKRVSL